MARLSWLRPAVVAATLAMTAACYADANKVGGPDRCVMQLAAILPPAPELNIGDTITLRAQFYHVAADCLPPDTTSKNLRWVASSEGALGVITIDSVTARVTALKTGWMGIIAQARFKNGSWSGYSGVGVASVTVIEPPTADTLVSRVSNQVADSATVILEDANGNVQRTQTLAGHGSTCWVTPLSDSVRYRAVINSPSGATMVDGSWITHHALLMTHTWSVTVQNTVHAIGLNGDTGC